MSTALASRTGQAGLITQKKSTAASRSATKINRMQEAIREHLLTSYVIRHAAERALTELDEVRAEASEVGWNGYGGLPVTSSAYSSAKNFLKTLPTTSPLPEVSADPDGEVALDWIFGEKSALTVSIGINGRCTFAWMIGQSTYRGTDWIEDEIPASIIFALGQLARHSAATKVIQA